MKNIPIIIVIVLILAGGIWAFTQTNPDPFPSIAILEGSVVQTNSEGTMSSVSDGDILSIPTTLITDEIGRAIVYFPEGSLLHIDPSTEITIEEGSFDTSENILAVDIQLLAGRVWSTVVSFANTESSWNVETPNAVATVRGTSFGAEFVDGISAFIGSESTVDVGARNPETGEVIPDTTTPLSTEDVIEVTDEIVTDILENPDTLPIRELTPRDRFYTWVRSSEEREARIRSHIRDLREEGLSQSEIRDRIKDQVKDALEERRDTEIQTDEEPTPDTTPPSVTEDPVREPTHTDPQTIQLDQSEDTTTTGSGSDTIAAQLQRLEIISSVDLSQPVPEGESVTFQARGIFSDATEQDVTTDVSWKVIGSESTITSDGVFIPRLSPNMAEFGKGYASVAATWTSPQGNELVGTTDIFTVVPMIPEDITREG